MAKYQVTARNGLRIRTGPSTSYQILGVYPNGTTYVAPDDEQQNGWVKVSSPIEGWACMTYLKCTEKQAVVEEAQKPAIEQTKVETVTETNSTTDESDAANQVTPVTAATVEQKYLEYVRAFGAPPQLTDYADPPIYFSDTNTIMAKCGRVYAETFLTIPSIVSILPCEARYLPGWTTGEKDTFFDKLLENVDEEMEDLIEGDRGLSGRLYETTPVYKKYMDSFNCLCRIAAITRGLGDVKMPGTQTPLKSFDYSYYTTPYFEEYEKKHQSLFSAFTGAFSSGVAGAFDDREYIHYFPTSISADESITNQHGGTMIEEAFSGQLDDLSKNMQLLAGLTDPDASLDADIQSIFESSDVGFFKSFTSLVSNFAKGGRIVFPDIITESDYGKSISVNCTFASPYGNILSEFLRCIVPTLSILSFVVPKQLAEDMYTIPYLCRVKQDGVYNSDFSYISNVSIKRGGSNNTAWTTWGGSTIYEVSFTVTPLYSKLMLPSAAHPFLALGNNAMLEYIGNMCGIDLKASNINLKLKLAKELLAGRIKDMPANLGKNISNLFGLKNILNNWNTFSNR